MLIVYILVLVGLAIYSYALVDPNFTLINHFLWTGFRNQMVNLGYYEREWSFAIYLILLVLLFLFNLYFTNKKMPAIKIAIVVSGVLILSYPFLSHDFFNYLFDAKIFTYYHQNPYLHKALDFPNDPWLRFMHWTHRAYPYGPSFLLISFVPSILSFGKLILAFLFFKLMFVGFYLLAVWSLSKFDQKKAIFLATSPLVIIEGLVNNHNDLIAVSLGITALYFFYKQKNKIKAAVFGLLSVGIKYVSVVFVVLVKKSKANMTFSLIGFFSLLLFMYFKVGIQPWYFLNLAILLVSVKKYRTSGSILSIGLLLSYYPYIVLGGWDTVIKVQLKEQIILAGILLFLASIFIGNRRKISK